MRLTRPSLHLELRSRTFPRTGCYQVMAPTCWRRPEICSRNVLTKRSPSNLPTRLRPILRYHRYQFRRVGKLAFFAPLSTTTSTLCVLERTSRQRPVLESESWMSLLLISFFSSSHRYAHHVITSRTKIDPQAHRRYRNSFVGLGCVRNVQLFFATVVSSSQYAHAQRAPVN